MDGKLQKMGDGNLSTDRKLAILFITFEMVSSQPHLQNVVLLPPFDFFFFLQDPNHI